MFRPVVAHPSLLTKQRLARDLDVSPRTLNRWMKDGMPHLRLPNGHPRFTRDEVDSWLFAGRAERFQAQAAASGSPYGRAA